jgi:hypothetical protein
MTNIETALNLAAYHDSRAAHHAANGRSERATANALLANAYRKQADERVTLNSQRKF